MMKTLPTKKHYMLTVILATLILCSTVGAGCAPENASPISPTYKYVKKGETAGSSGERGNMLISEIHYAGSVTNEGTWDPDDVFIELWNKNPRPINVSGWRLEIGGDYTSAHLIPETTRAIEPNGFFVIAVKANGAFSKVADVFIPELRLGKDLVLVTLRDLDRKRMESGGSDRQTVFAGGYDTVTARSMERAQIIFGNRGGSAANWHAYSQDLGSDTIAAPWRQRTLASPGQPNSPDYSGSTSVGNYE